MSAGGASTGDFLVMMRALQVEACLATILLSLVFGELYPVIDGLDVAYGHPCRLCGFDTFLKMDLM